MRSGVNGRSRPDCARNSPKLATMGHSGITSVKLQRNSARSRRVQDAHSGHPGRRKDNFSGQLIDLVLLCEHCGRSRSCAYTCCAQRAVSALHRSRPPLASPPRKAYPMFNETAAFNGGNLRVSESGEVTVQIRQPATYVVDRGGRCVQLGGQL